MMDPRYHEELYREVTPARWVGKASSVIRMGQARDAMATPKPMRNREAINIPKFWDAVWIATPMMVTRWSARCEASRLVAVLTDVTDDDGVSSTNSISELRSER